LAEYEEESWIAVLWKQATRIPSGPLGGSLLVYYRILQTYQNEFLPIIGLVPYKIGVSWTNVHDLNGEIDVNKTEEILTRARNMREQAN
jgi:hypothetical protein